MPSADFALEDWIVRPGRCLIERGASSVRVKPKSMAVLCRLAETAGEVVSRQELFDAVWPGSDVTDDVLTASVVELRKAFGDSARSPRIIETIPRMGLRLIPAVSSLDAVEAAPAAGGSLAIPALVGVAALAAAAVLWMLLADRPTPHAVAGASVTGPEKSLAVLPFLDMSPGQDQAYFADGLTEELINRLANLEDLFVAGRTSSFYFKGRHEDLRDIGRQLDVNYILEGSIRKSGTELRVTAQLIEVASGFHLWSHTFERQLEDVFDIQDEISESVATAMSVELGVGVLGRIPGATSNLDAYEAFLRGGASFKKMTTGGLDDAIAEYKRAIGFDPGFAIAWSSIAFVHAAYWLVEGVSVRDERHELAQEAVDRALELAPESQPVLLAAAFLAADREQWARAQRYYDRADSLGQLSVTKLDGGYADMRFKLGYVDEVVRLQERTRRVEPLLPLNHAFVAHLLISGGRFDEAEAQLDIGYEADTKLSYVSNEGVILGLHVDDVELTRHWLDRAAEHAQPGGAGVDRAMLERLGNRAAMLDWLSAAYARSPNYDYYVVLWATYLGDYPLALKALARSRDLWLFWLPLLEPLRSTDEFKAVVEDAGLVDYWREHGWNDFCRPIGETDWACS